MIEQKFKMIDRAAVRHNEPIVPVGDKLFFRECFVESNGKLHFWYNTIREDGTHDTHLLVEDISNG